MNSKTIKFFLLFLLGVLFSISNIYAEGGDKGENGNRLEKPGSPIRAYMNINFISTIFKNTGISDINAGQDASGLIYPKGSGKTAVYQSGFLWAAIVGDPNEDDPHVGGTVYREGLQSGWIDANGNVIPEDDPSVRIWRVRPDVYPGGPNVDLGPEATDENRTEADVRSQYELDWVEWPATIGAPYLDVDSNGVYNPEIDVPGVPGANQTIWFVANDQAASRTSFMYGTQPMGIEQQATIWAYSQTGALGNMIFRRYLIINKTDVLGSNRTFDSMYVSMWSDPDVGDSGDDYAGCDTVLSVSYAYNGKGQDAIYGGTTPCLGFDFFQGPLVTGIEGEDRNKNGVDDASDYGIFKNQRVGPGLINLPMTAAYYYINTDPTLTDPVQGSYPEGAVRWYRFMKGRIGLTNEPFVDPNTGKQTPFTLPGDPVSGTGWIDGQQFAYADRRIGMASGPFTMAPGDTQEVVVAEILAGAIQGVDRLSAISLMKFYDQIAQLAYDNFFDLPTPPPPPAVKVTKLNNEIVLDWGSDPLRVQATENQNSKGFSFQGYNVYQLPTASSSPSEGVRIATYDIIDGVGKIYDLTFDPTTGSVVNLPVQFGNDYGITRYISITQDAINQTPLVDGVRYYFAVTAYNYNPDPTAVPNNLENPLRIITIIPQSNNPGVTYGSMTGDTLSVVHVSGSSDGIVEPVVVDPTSLTGDNYLVTFSNPDDSSEFAVASRWELKDVTKNEIVYTGENLSGNGQGTIDSANYYPILDGLYMVVAGPPEAVNSYSTTGTRWVSGTDGGLEQFFGGLGVGKNFFGSDLPASDYYPVEMRWVGGPNDPSEANGWSQGATYRRDLGYAYAGVGWMPFTVWDVSDPDNPVQINACFVEDDVEGTGNLQWDMGWNPVDSTFLPLGGREYIFLNNTPYDPDYYGDPSEPGKDGTYNDVLYAIWPSQRGDHPYLEDDWTMTIVPNYAVLVTDSYTFYSTAPTYSSSLAQDQVDEINVFPNPYYGFSSEELNKYNRFVTFNHLPTQANVRIFNLAGVMVRTLEKQDQGQFMYWDLNNQDGLPVASGLYIVYIDMPELGTTKILKVAIIQEQQVLDRF